MLLIPVIVLIGGDGFRDFLNFGAGVLSLVSLTCSVIWGLVATDRLFLSTRQRLIAQAIHRSTAVASIAFLFLHITVKIALDHTTVLAALVPFSLGVSGTAALIGFGSLAALLMVVTGLTGALRSAFASPAPVAARWRAVHTLAYPAWCSALVHGLFAGRPANGWVVAMYSLCLLAVIGAISLRSAPLPVKRRVAAQILAVLQPGGRPGDRERLPRRDTTEMPLPGVAAPARGDTRGDTGSMPSVPTGPPRDERDRRASQAPRMPAPSPPLYEAPRRPSEPRQTGASLGMAAAYRAVSMPPPPYPEELPGTFPDDFRAAQASYGPAQPPPDVRPTEVLPRADEGLTGRWPAPSPPPPAEAPASAYDPADETPYAGTQGYGAQTAQNAQTYGTQAYAGPTYDTPTYDTPSYGAPDYGTPTRDPAAYPAPEFAERPNDPATEPLPGPFQAPSSGEPWNAPTGGFK
ncbi:cytochrome b/b6 domain-containing protein [Streptomyces sp. NPDC091292]|uniref:cytochrome b/b6 domain-containing protein n=1 Tax=Streptomyces sp. NPDC091292 TaxID=3365991 RepID=UPI00380A77D3